jgi:hypothetical protein
MERAGQGDAGGGQKQQRACAFCGHLRPLTKEHIWPDWLRGVFPSLETPAHIFGVVGDKDSWYYQKRPAFSRRAKIVCGECNNGWMSRLEMTAAPLITPMLTGERKVALNLGEQATVAFWIVKTAMTMQLSHPTRRPDAIPDDQYRFVFGEQRPPDTCQVWIGACSHEDRPPNVPLAQVGRCRIGPLIRFRPVDIAPDEPTRRAYVATMSIGNLAMQVFGHQYPTSQVQLRYPDLAGSALIQIWPALATDAEWPGPVAIDYPTFDHLTRAFGQFM